MLAFQADSSNTKTNSEKWGYVLVGSAINSLLRNLEGETAVEAYFDFSERRERANELLFDLVGQPSSVVTKEGYVLLTLNR